MGVHVEFDLPLWLKRYPEFGSVDPAQIQAYFGLAEAYHDNTGVGQPTNTDTQQVLLGMLVAHIVARYATVNGVAPSGLVGPVISASEGSVSVTVANLIGKNPAMAWFMTTKYGLDYWYATAPYRTAQYRPGYSRSTPNPNYRNPYIPW